MDAAVLVQIDDVRDVRAADAREMIAEVKAFRALAGLYERVIVPSVSCQASRVYVPGLAHSPSIRTVQGRALKPPALRAGLRVLG